MKQETNDIVIKVLTEWEQYEARMNFDTDGTTVLRNFVNIMRSMTFTGYTILESLKEVANEIEDDMKFYNNENNIELEYATTD